MIAIRMVHYGSILLSDVMSIGDAPKRTRTTVRSIGGEGRSTP